ncbi:uncharacterized protein LOC108028087 isoform X3 [Drosophila biarmipes]|uniref:uncharacterized protein LOC108028087 isoform X3 n=1 Tax=Drosophila biarmipes TaxID=125945 RepID=UPI0021CCD221|nr:uncharacterized protein LOC108028087 isoform X3 [Drosophila biarmipes]
MQGGLSGEASSSEASLNMRMWKLRVCKYAIYFLWVINIAQGAHGVLEVFVQVLHDGRPHRICSEDSAADRGPTPDCVSHWQYVTVLFLATWLQMMLTFLLAQEYQAIADVLRIWLQHKSLAFFEVNSKCCGVLGPDDYKFSERPIPASCFRDGSFKHHDLYHDGCSTRSIRPRLVPVLQVTSVIVQYVLVIAIAIYLVIMIRNRAHRRTLWSVRRTELFGTAEPAEVRGSPQDSKLNVLEGYFSVPHRS